MNEQDKPWYGSRTVWAALVTIAAGGAGAAGLTIAEGEQQALIDGLLGAVTAIAGLVALFGRLAARRRIG